MNNWTIGFITAGTQNALLTLGAESVRREVPEAQLIIVGGESNIDCDTHIPFQEDSNPGWITKKKNLIVQNSECDNIAILHDYLCLEPGWLQGVESFGYDWLTCMHKVINADNSRYRDWCVIYNDAWMNPPIDSQVPPSDLPGRMMHYVTRGHERWQYYSGSFFCAKKQVLLEVPLNESRLIGQGEDVEHCRRLYKKYGPEVFQMNTQASVRLLKYKNPVPWQKLPLL